MMANLFQFAIADINVITRVAGTYGTTTFDGDGGQATAAKLYYPKGVYKDSSGVLYIADVFNKRLRKVDTAGIISTVFGTGSSTVAGNDGAATAASGALFNIHGDSTGTLYVASFDNSVVRKISNGIITAFAGGGSVISTDGVPATSASLAALSCAVSDTAGNVYINTVPFIRVRKVLASTGKIYTVAGTGTAPTEDTPTYNGEGGPATSAAISSPWIVYLDSSSHMYIGSYYGYNVRQVDLTTGIITTIAGTGTTGYSGDGGPATSAGLYGTLSVAGDTAGNAYIGSASGGVRKVDGTTGIISKYAGAGSLQNSNIDGNAATDAYVSQVTGIYVADGKLYFPNTMVSVIHAVDLTPSTYAPSFTPTLVPSVIPTTLAPSTLPTIAPSALPTVTPSLLPSVVPTLVPSQEPTVTPTLLPTVHPSLIPTAIPTVTPSQSPSVAPTDPPTLLPTVHPSLIPTVIPTVTPSQSPSVAPTDSPSVEPSVAPSVLPSLEPTVVPTRSPSAIPTRNPTTPTRKPTAMPSVKPTRVGVTAVPTFAPSATPTAAPTTHVDITFDANLYLFNTSESTLSDNSVSAVTSAVATTANVSTSQVSVVSSSVVGGRRLLTASVLDVVHGPPYDLLVVVNIQASTAGRSEADGLNGSALYHQLSSALYDAVESNEFTSTLSVAAQSYSAYGLYFLARVNLTLSDFTVMPPDDVASDGGSDNDHLSRGDFAGIVIGIIVSFLVLLALCYYCVNGFRLNDGGHREQKTVQNGDLEGGIAK